MGPDGPWASFKFDISTDAEGANSQIFDAFPAFAQPICLVPPKGKYCNSSGTSSSDRATTGFLQADDSRYWTANTGDVFPDLGLSSFVTNGLSAQPNGQAIVIMKTTRSDSAILGHIVVAGIDSKDLFKALFVLSTGALIMGTYRNTSQAASSSFSYTAGSWARGRKTPSLIWVAMTDHAFRFRVWKPVSETLC